MIVVVTVIPDSSRERQNQLRYRGSAAQLSFSARLRYAPASGFSMSRTSCGLRRTTTRSPAASRVVSCPSQNNVVPGCTLDAVIVTLFRDETTTGRNERLWAQMGVRHSASTPGSMIGLPAETLYAVEPLGVETITPFPK